jgi:hypothetical protein
MQLDYLWNYGSIIYWLIKKIACYYGSTNIFYLELGEQDKTSSIIHVLLNIIILY